MNKFLLSIALLMNINAMAQIQPVRPRPVIVANLAAYDTIRDAQNKQLVFKGSFSITDLRNEPSFTWLQKGMDSYHPDTNAVNYLKQYIRNYDMKIFMGTWCEDSQDLIPRLFKTLLEMKQTLVTKRVIGLDRNKTTTEDYMEMVRDSKVTLVPTIILYKDGKEAGRITETVNKSIEADLMAIVKKNNQ